MIGVGFPSPAVRPFYARGPGGIVTYALGAAAYTTGALVYTMTVSLGATDTLLVGIGYDGVILGASAQVTIDGNALAGVLSQIYDAALNSSVEMWEIPLNGTAVSGGTLAVDFTTVGVAPANLGIVARGVTALQQAPDPFDVGNNNFGNSATPDSGLTPMTAIANEFVYGVISARGTAGDLAGAWQGGFVTGQRAATAALGVDIRDGWLLPAATGTFKARQTGCTLRRWGALCGTYLGA